MLRAVIFDWDGTLVDSAEVTYRCYAAMFEHFGIAFSRADYERTYAPAWHRTYEQMGLRADQHEEASRRWLSAYATSECRLFDGAGAQLQRLIDSGLLLGIVTSGDRSRVHRELGALGVEEHFRVFVAGNDCEKKKPHPEGLLRALGELAIDAGEAVYVGDSPEDIEMARRANVRSIGIPGGFPNRDALLRSNASRYFDTLADAVDFLLAERDEMLRGSESPEAGRAADHSSGSFSSSSR
jgi:HAD superfamily hydrolase (TIGR01509 family)